MKKLGIISPSSGRWWSSWFFPYALYADSCFGTGSPFHLPHTIEKMPAPMLRKSWRSCNGSCTVVESGPSTPKARSPSPVVQLWGSPYSTCGSEAIETVQEANKPPKNSAETSHVCMRTKLNESTWSTRWTWLSVRLLYPLVWADWSWWAV